MENQIEAQALLIQPDLLAPFNLGDTNIHWVASDGNPTSTGASITGNASFNNTDEGVNLTPATNATSGYLYWSKNYDYKNSIIFTLPAKSGAGTGADGMTVFFGASSPANNNNAYGNIAVYFDEYGSDDTIRIYKNGVQQGVDYKAYKTLDDNTYNNYQIVYQYLDSSNSYLYVLMNGNYVAKINIGSWTPAGNLIGVSAWCGSQNNVHSVKSFSAKTAKPWLSFNL